MTKRQYRAAEVRAVPSKVDDFLRARMSPDSPVQIMRRKHLEAIKMAYREGRGK